MDRKNLPWLLTLALAAFVVNANVFRNDFIYDDTALIVLNKRIRSLENLDEILLTPYWGPEIPSNLYRPLVMLTFAADHALWGKNATGYHWTNVLLHIVNVLLIFLLAVRLGSGRPTAFGAALLFSAHPIHVEAVAGVVGRSEVLCLMFLLASCLLYLRPPEGKWRHFRAPTIGAAFFFGLVSKETAVCIPAILLVLEWLYGPREKGEKRGARAGRIFRREAAVVVALVVAFAAYFLLRAAVVRQGVLMVRRETTHLENPLVLLAFPARLLGFLRVAGLYLFHLVWPVPLSPDYSYDSIPMTFSFGDADLYLSGLAIAGLVALTVYAGRRRKECAFFGWFALFTWFPASSVVVVIGTIMGDRLMYAPSVAFCWGVSAAVMWLAGHLWEKEERRKAVVAGVAFLGFLAAALGGRTLWYNAKWRDNLTLFRHAARVAPRSYKIHYLLGDAYLDLDPRLSVEHYRKSLDIEPGFHGSLQNMGTAHSYLRNWEEAAKFYVRAIEVRPDWAFTYCNLGNCYLYLGRYGEALEQFELFRETLPEQYKSMADPHIRRAKEALGDR